MNIMIALTKSNFVSLGKEEKVRDHYHVSGKCRGAAHGTCNVKFRIPSFMPVVMHNLKCYDSHLIMQPLGKVDAEVT